MTPIPGRRGMLTALSRTGGGDLASKAAVLATTVVVARLLDPATFAVYAGLLAVTILAGSFWDAGISTVVITAIAGHGPTRAILRRVLVARLITLPIWLVVLALGFLLFGTRTQIGPGTVLAVSIASVAAATSIPLQAILRAHLQFGRPAVAAAAGRWLTAAMTVGLLIAGPAKDLLPVVFLAQAAGEVTTLVIAAVFVSRTGEGDTRGPWDPREVSLRRSFPYAANSVLAVAYNRLDIVLVATLTTTAQLAAYSPASRLQDALYLIPTALASIALPYLSRTLAGPGGVEASRALVRQLWKIGLLLTVPAAAILILWMPAVIGMLLGSDYEGSVPAARILSLSMIAAVVGGPILGLLIAAGRGGATTKAFAAAFGASVVLNLTLDWWLGSIGAAIASVGRDVMNLMVAAYYARDLLGAVRPRPGPIGVAGNDGDQSVEPRRQTQ
jgi:lipopolysaccharide exporter